MELWIRSQDKETLIKIDYLYLDGTNKNVIIGYCQSTFTSPKLGTYKSKGRALEILDEIQDLIKPKIITTSYECEKKENLSKSSFDLEMIPQKTEIQELSTIVYEMPKE